VNTTANAAAPVKSGAVRRKLILFGATLIAVAALVYLDRHTGGYLGQFASWMRERVFQFAEWVQGLGPWGPAAFILGYVIATVVLAPGWILTMGSGILFGLAGGTLYTLIGATLGSSAAFLIARYAARGVVERKIAGNPKFAAIDRAVGREGWKIVALLRLSPVVPFNLLNYALGLTRVRFLHYVAASVAMLPGTLLYVYYGKAIGSFAGLESGAKVERGIEYWIFLGAGLLATIVVTAYVTRLAGRALRREIAAPGATAEGRHV
jgi:uncharacterized membrane protein YdjX (TVP38/TMEM64 family)